MIANHSHLCYTLAAEFPSVKNLTASFAYTGVEINLSTVVNHQVTETLNDLQ